MGMAELYDETRRECRGGELRTHAGRVDCTSGGVECGAMKALIAVCVSLVLQGPPQMKMATYQLVILKKGPAFTSPQNEQTKKIMDGHVAHMMKLGAAGESLASGPVIDSGDMAGIMVMRAPSPEKARELEADDPAIEAGHFVMEVMPFMAPEGWFKPWAHPFAQETVYFGFLNSGPNRGQDAATAQQLQKDHLAYMQGQSEQGKLVLAGPFVEGGVRRGIVVYRVATMEEAQSRASGDPMIKAGRLAVELHPWLVPKGALP
jgi:uncharacterized protein YciI